MSIRVTVLRGETPESEHAVEGVVMDAHGQILAATPRPDRVTFFRSAAKPFQMLPFVERGHFDRLGLPEGLLALIAASHNGEPMHVAGARAILEACGRSEADLECGFQWPENDAATMDWLRQAPPEQHTGIYNNCSGKHAGMIALAVAEGWPVAGYTAADHPVQVAALDAIADVCQVQRASMPLGIDGCSAPNPALSLIAMTAGYARFAAARADGATPRARALARIRAAMVGSPELVGGTGRFCTALMRVTGGRLVTKTGAEGVQCVGEPQRGLGIVVKTVDGTRRAVAPALVGWLRALDLLSPAEADALAEFAHPTLSNHRKLVVGTIAAGEFPAWRVSPTTLASGSTSS